MKKQIIFEWALSFCTDLRMFGLFQIPNISYCWLLTEISLFSHVSNIFLPRFLLAIVLFVYPAFVAFVSLSVAGRPEEGL